MTKVWRAAQNIMDGMSFDDATAELSQDETQGVYMLLDTTTGFNPYAMHPGEIMEVYKEAQCVGRAVLLRSAWYVRGAGNVNPSHSLAPSETIVYRGL